MQDTGAHTLVVVEVGTFPLGTRVATSATAAWLPYSWRPAKYVVESSEVRPSLSSRWSLLSSHSSSWDTLRHNELGPR